MFNNLKKYKNKYLALKGGVDITVSYSANNSIRNYMNSNECTNLEEISTFLETLDLSTLTNMRKINSIFCNNCSRLEKLYLPPRIREIGSFFLTNCTNLKKLDLCKLTQMKYIKPIFCYNCSSLEELSLPAGIREIDSFFLTNCIKLRKLDLNTLTNMRKIKSKFCNNCSSLEELSLLSGITNIDSDLLTGCTEPVNQNWIREIGSDFLTDCTKLKKLDLSTLIKMTRINNKFCNNCFSLEELYLPPGITEIGCDFLIGCTNLRKLGISRKLLSVIKTKFDVSNINEIQYYDYDR